MLFEIHITGSDNIHDACKARSLKTIKIELLRKNYSVIRIDHMTSIHINVPNIVDAMFYVNELEEYLKSNNVDIFRSKVECPLLPEYSEFIKNSLYVECHFLSDNSLCPVSKNVGGSKFLGTLREYDKRNYLEFYFNKLDTNADVELCVCVIQMWIGIPIGSNIGGSDVYKNRVI